MSKVSRAIGAVLLLSGFLLGWLCWENLLHGKVKKTYTVLIGEGKGSRHRVCKEGTNSNLEKFNSVDFGEKPHSTLKYFLYNIENPKEYLSGENGIVVEKGPYMLRKHTAKYNVDFASSSISKSSNTENMSIEYDVARAYVVLDKNTDVTSTMKRNMADFSLSWSADQRTSLPAHDKVTPDHLKMNDKITNLSPIYLSVLGELNDEMSLVLSLSCSASAIENILLAGTKGQCSSLDDSDCACCMLDDEFLARGSPKEFTSCSDLLDDSGPTMSTLSMLAFYDGGVAVKNAGEQKFDGSGSTFKETMHKQTSIYSAVVQTHTVNDIMFGHPSAFIGKVVPVAHMSKAKEVLAASSPSISHTDVAKKILTGEMDDHIPLKLGNIAEYTKKVESVCSSTCEAVSVSDGLYSSPLGWMCQGSAPQRHETDVMDKIELGGIDCKPYSSTFATKQVCSLIEKVLTADSNAIGYDACVCANQDSDWKQNGCCLAGGTFDGLDLTANGCLYPVAGAVGPNYVGMSEASSSGKPKVDVGQAMEAWVLREGTSKVTQFMCPAEGVQIDEHFKFSHFEKYEGKSEFVTYYDTGEPRIRQNDKSWKDVKEYTSQVKGGDGKYFNPNGLTAYHLHDMVSDGHTWRDEMIPIFNEKMKSYVAFEEDWTLRAKLCGNKKCLPLARVKTTADAFNAKNETISSGTGHPFNGLKPIGHYDGPGASGRPAYVHQPLFFGGDEELFTQNNNSHVLGPVGNGIEIYRAKSETSDPSTFSVGGLNANYHVVDKLWVDENKDSLQSYFDMEASTGFAVRSKMRFGLSYSIWECDPETNEHCKLGRISTGDGDCYAKAAVNHFSGLDVSLQTNLSAVNRSDFSYACSAANVLTPKTIGGKIIPMYWYEEARTEVKKDAPEVKFVEKMTVDWFNTAQTYNTLMFFALMIGFVIGPSLVFQIGCCQGEMEFLKHGIVGEDGKVQSQTTASSTVSAVSTAPATN